METAGDIKEKVVRKVAKSILNTVNFSLLINPLAVSQFS
jgi:hypothetical protein